MNVATAPSADWVTLDALIDDPYPVYDRLRALGPVVHAPHFGIHIVTSFDGCRIVEADRERFEEDGNALRAAMGEVMLSKGDPEHARERAAVNPALRPKAIAEVWRAHFETNAARALERFRALGPGADFNTGFALPYAAMNLGVVVGLPNVPWETLQRWSLTFIAAVAKQAQGDLERFADNDTANSEADAAIDRRVAELAGRPDASMISMMIAAGLPPDLIRANAKLAISGGINEPQHVLTTGIYALAAYPDQLAAVRAGTATYAQVFDEAVRWISPIQSQLRRARVDAEVHGVVIPAGSPVWVLLGAANRDPGHFDRPEQFIVSRPRKPHLAFGSGIHMCAGSWAARSSAEVAWPLLYDALPGLTPVDSDARFHGFFFRGLPQLPVTWAVDTNE
ncbi:cytochrome P450 [Nocardia sp. NPDC050378]|uniref:cytochrome P450 n=1 Tax=Nocardia sp. NPDC050378 TaxID=3155400 RepID=UPI0033DD84A3